MPKKYKYSVVLLGNYDGTYTEFENVFPVYNHKITETDINKLINNKNSEEIDQKWFSAIPTLLSVSGDHTYRVTYETRESLCTPINNARLCTLDHKFTASSYDEDIQSFTDQIRKSLTDRQHSQILFIQEIPDE
jgi:hypothetical protein